MMQIYGESQMEIRIKNKEGLVNIMGVRSETLPWADVSLACTPNRRSIKLEQIFCSVLDKFPDGVVIKDTDVVINHDYNIENYDIACVIGGYDK